MNEPRHAPAQLRTLVADALVAHRTSRPNAQSVAAALVGAETEGQGGHGLRRVAAYCAQAKAGKVDGHAIPAASVRRAGVLSIDAGHGFAYPAFDLAIARLPAMAAANGIAMAAIFRSHHAGVAGRPAELLAKSGCAALLFANAPASIAPWGSGTALYGTDPIAFAAPRPDGEPVVVDLSLSKVARGRLMAAAQKGESIPEGWARDSAGQPTTDPRAGMAGTMIPMGDAKGAALALMVEILAAGLTGANYAYEQSSFFDAQGGPPGSGQLLIAIDAGAASARALARIGEMAMRVEQAQGARLPGRRRQELRRDMERDGVPVEPELYSQIARLAQGGA
jgi:(2R)-3-sulfolactate dehydrogenase (NADP+)